MALLEVSSTDPRTVTENAEAGIVTSLMGHTGLGNIQPTGTDAMIQAGIKAAGGFFVGKYAFRTKAAKNGIVLGK